MTFHSKDAMAMQLAFEHKNWPALKMFAKKIIDSWLERQDFDDVVSVSVKGLKIQGLSLNFQSNSGQVTYCSVNDFEIII